MSGRPDESPEFNINWVYYSVLEKHTCCMALLFLGPETWLIMVDFTGNEDRAKQQSMFSEATDSSTIYT